MFTTRRGLLVGAAVLAAAGCTREPAKIITSDADLTAALRTARSLAQGAEALGFSDIAEDHLTHAATLERLLRPASIGEEATEAPADVAALAEAEAAGSREAADACLATDSDYAVLLGEIAAARAAHAAVLA
ncbi:hypothetical protein K3N28_03745 [Glycomyces sp. TRM65418]|uniref:hypothetical protein n=1 Tax=Glycomyces sp. TRM65418 TaxID=2867006 RepID=UPI001CE5C270|nr:hypothetical protein [Glycomyces sp. TRM65418]MCC3762185.1 hypothetical protein [Glycomyces sp. TRM65418]QZD56245.1 hypothetical protein K3N28_03720 [Glycomyces sp. TRM65418]